MRRAWASADLGLGAPLAAAAASWVLAWERSLNASGRMSCPLWGAVNSLPRERVRLPLWRQSGLSRRRAIAGRLRGWRGWSHSVNGSNCARVYLLALSLVRDDRFERGMESEI